MAEVSALLYSFVILLLFAKTNCDCKVDQSVTNSEEKSAVGDIIKLLEPIGTKTYSVEGTSGRKYSVSVCGGDAGETMPQSAVVEKVASELIPVGYRNRTLAFRGADWVEVVWLSSTNYSAADACASRPRTARLLVTCDYDVQGPSPTLKSDPVPGLGCFNSFSTSHSLACSAPRPSSGLGGFSVFLIVVSVLFATYLLLGVAYMRFVKGAKGIDQLPNKLFWFRTGNAIADCTGVLCRCDKHFGDSNFDDYTSVSGGSAPYSDGGLSGGGATRPLNYQSGGAYADAGGADLLAPQRGSTDSDLLQP